MDLVPLVGMSKLTVRTSDTSLAHGSNDLQSISPSVLTTLAEGAVQAALNEKLGSGESSITTRLHLEISDIAGVGSELFASAKSTQHDGGNYYFDIAISHDDTIIAHGEIVRKVIDRVTMSAKIAARSRR